MYTFQIFSELIIAALLPVAASVILYILDRKTSFGRFPYAVRQAIIGVVFGAIAVYGTECGVSLDGAVVNARDAAPLAAGLFFGGPAGIIAGLIGGIERWFAVYWGVGMYSRVACSVSTALAGLYAAALRKYLFDDKYPSWGMGLITGIVMEVIHLTLLFFTHFSDAEQAFEIVKVCTIPMIGANGLSVMLTSVVLTLLIYGRSRHTSKEKKISQRVQSWLLLTVVISYLVTSVFTYTLQTGTAIMDATNMMKLYINDIESDIADISDSNLLSITQAIAGYINSNPSATMEDLAQIYGVPEINLIDTHGIIYDSTNPDFVGFDMSSGEQAAEFMVLLDGKAKELVQEYRPITYQLTDTTTSRKYAGVVLNAGGFVQVGYDADSFQRDIAETVKGLADNRHVGTSGFMLIADSNFALTSRMNGHGSMHLYSTGIKIGRGDTAGKLNTGIVDKEESYWMYDKSEGYYIIAVMPKAEVFNNRTNSTYVNSYMEVLVFAALFILVYMLIKKLVVNNIRSVNESLSQIIGGNLDVVIDVRSSMEFSSLSDDINSTVTTLKHYIDAAAARIDEELEFAKKIQFSTLPSTFPAYPNNPEFDIHATMCTAKEVGGDFYDFYMLGDNKLAFIIADVSGKGIPAAMFMMTAKTIIQGLAESGLAVNEIFTQANSKLCEENEAGMFVTAWMGILDIRTGHVEFACAGHNPPLIYRKDRGFEYLKMRPGFVLAGMEGVKYRLQELTLEPGDKIYLYTDGVTEATNSQIELYGEKRLNEFLDRHDKLSAKDTLIEVKQDIDSFVGEAEQFDDITMLMVDYCGSPDTLITEKVFPASDTALAEVTDFVQETLDRLGCKMSVSMQIAVALEEIFVNIAHYAYSGGEGTVKLSLFDSDGSIKLRFADSGLQFNPLAKTDPDVSLSAEERSIGGLGIYIVKKTMDDVSYEYRDGLNIFTMTKKLK